MSNALSIAASGLRSQEYNIDKIAHDLANLNTPNYKASKIVFADLLYQNLAVSNRQNSLKLGLGASVYRTSKDFSQGPLKPTNDWKNLAIDGQGFFQVINSDGNIAYTRNSSFTVDEEHYLVTQDGMRLADNIQIPEEAVEINIKENGEVEALLADESETQLLGNIKLAKFIEAEALDPIGNGLYKATEKSGDALIDNPGSSGLGKIMQKHIEGSNVDMVNTLMQLTLAQRIYQLNAKAVQIADELEKMTNEIPN